MSLICLPGTQPTYPDEPPPRTWVVEPDDQVTVLHDERPHLPRCLSRGGMLLRGDLIVVNDPDGPAHGVVVRLCPQRGALVREVR